MARFRRVSRSGRVTIIPVLMIVALMLPGAVSASQTGNECGLAPLALPLFQATPVAIIAATPAVVADNPPVDDAAVEVAMQVIVACANNVDPAVAYAIFTNRYLASQFLDPAVTYLPAFEYMLATGAETAEGTLVLDSVVSWQVLPDGRLQVEARMGNDSASFTDTFILAHNDGAWLIDEVMNLEPEP